jgi:hypothetical protein
MKQLFTIACLIFATTLVAQDLIDFEVFSVPSDSFLNGSDGSGGFSTDQIFLPNNYNSDFSSWTGWSLSNKTDTLTAGFTNPYSAIAGSGVDGSENFAISYSFGENRLILQGEAMGRTLDGIYLTNNTYAYLSMRDGDAFAKKIGGVTGNDPDYFRLTIKAYTGGQLSTDSVDFYLADFRFADNAQDYIIKDWTFVDLSSLGPVDSLAFILTSSDVGQFGMNTPAYFCLDNIVLGAVVSTTNTINRNAKLRVFPNPTSDFIQLDYEGKHAMICTILDLQGRPLIRRVLSSTYERVGVQHLPAGTYLVHLRSADYSATQLFQKK